MRQISKNKLIDKCQEGELTKWIFGEDGFVAIQRVRISLVIVCLHAELILVSRLQASHLQLWCVSVSAATWHPTACKTTHHMLDPSPSLVSS